jgi:hypothetical protein
VILDLPTWIRLEAQRSEGFWSREVRGGEVVEIAPPVIFGQGPVDRLSEARKRSFPGVGLSSMLSARIATRDGVVISHDDRVLRAMTTNWGDPFDQHPIFHVTRLPRVARKMGTFSSIIFPAAYRNYYHWLHDSLLRLAILVQGSSCSYPVIVPQGPAWIRESLGMLKPQLEFVEFGEEHWELERLVLPSRLGTSGFSRPWACDWMREALGVEGLASGTRRLYISRAHAVRRRVLNDDHLVGLLEREGFEVVTPENLDFRGQVRLFSTASIIVAPHGAGLANLLVSPRGTAVVELMSPSYVNPCYYSLCGAIGHRYACVFGTTQRQEDGPDRATMGDDMTVTAELVTRAIRALSA